MRQIEFNPAPYQTFTHTVDSVEMRFVLAWNETAKVWSLDIYDNIAGELLQGGGAVVSGVNLLQITPYYRLFAIFLNRQGIIHDPARDTLSTGTLYIGELSELAL